MIQSTFPRKMSSSTLIEVFGHILFSFTRGVTEHYNPQEPEYTAESFGYDPLQSTGREWSFDNWRNFLSSVFNHFQENCSVHCRTNSALRF